MKQKACFLYIKARMVKKVGSVGHYKDSLKPGNMTYCIFLFVFNQAVGKNEQKFPRCETVGIHQAWRGQQH